MRRDLVCAALGLALAAAVWAAAAALPASLLSDEVGAGGVPKGLAVALAILSALLGLRALWRRPASAAGAEPHLRALGVAGMGFAYAAAAAFLGYALSVMLLAGAGAVYYGVRRPVHVALFAAGSAALLWFLFARVLGVAMP